MQICPSDSIYFQAEPTEFITLIERALETYGTSLYVSQEVIPTTTEKKYMPLPFPYDKTLMENYSTGLLQGLGHAQSVLGIR